MAVLPKIDSVGLRLAKLTSAERVSSVTTVTKDESKECEMNDIVKRLRMGGPNAWEMVSEAADEIERLQADKEGLQLSVDRLREMVLKRDDEINQLRTYLLKRDRQQEA